MELLHQPFELGRLVEMHPAFSCLTRSKVKQRRQDGSAAAIVAVFQSLGRGELQSARN